MVSLRNDLMMVCGEMGRLSRRRSSSCLGRRRSFSSCSGPARCRRRCTRSRSLRPLLRAPLPLRRPPPPAGGASGHSASSCSSSRSLSMCRTGRSSRARRSPPKGPGTCPWPASSPPSPCPPPPSPPRLLPSRWPPPPPSPAARRRTRRRRRRPRRRSSASARPRLLWRRRLRGATRSSPPWGRDSWGREGGPPWGRSSAGGSPRRRAWRGRPLESPALPPSRRWARRWASASSRGRIPRRSPGHRRGPPPPWAAPPAPASSCPEGPGACGPAAMEEQGEKLRALSYLGLHYPNQLGFWRTEIPLKNERNLDKIFLVFL